MKPEIPRTAIQEAVASNTPVTDLVDLCYEKDAEIERLQSSLDELTDTIVMLKIALAKAEGAIEG